MEENKDRVYLQGGIYIRKVPFTRAELYSHNGIYTKSNGDDKVFAGMNDFFYLKISEPKDGKKGMYMIGQRGSNEIRDILPVTDRDIETKYQNLIDFLSDENFVGKFATSSRKITRRYIYPGKEPILVLYKSKEKALIFDSLGMRLYSNDEYKFLLEEKQHIEAKNPKVIYITAMEEILEKQYSHDEIFRNLLKRQIEDREV